MTRKTQQLQLCYFTKETDSNRSCETISYHYLVSSSYWAVRSIPHHISGILLTLAPLVAETCQICQLLPAKQVKQNFHRRVSLQEETAEPQETH